MFIFITRVALLSVQQKIVDQLLLVFSGKGEMQVRRPNWLSLYRQKHSSKYFILGFTEESKSYMSWISKIIFLSEPSLNGQLYLVWSTNPWNLEFVHYSFLNYRLRCLEHTDRSCSDSLFTLQVSGELDTVSEAAQGVHALQNIRVQICKRQNPLHTHAPRGWLLWTRLVPAPSETERHTDTQANQCGVYIVGISCNSIK